MFQVQAAIMIHFIKSLNVQMRKCDENWLKLETRLRAAKDEMILKTLFLLKSFHVVLCWNGEKKTRRRM